MLDHLYVVSSDGLQLVSDSGALLIWEPTTVQTIESRQSLVRATEQEYQRALLGLLPTGLAWPRDSGSTLGRTLLGLAIGLARVDGRAADLFEEVDPGTTAELLADWERVVGLPDPCVTSPQTVAERRQALASRLTSSGGQSRSFFVQLASRLGYSVTITEFRSAAEATAAGVPFVGSQWAHIWRMNVAQSVGVRPFLAGAGTAGEPLTAFGNEVLECQVNRFKPAHTQVLFAYAS